MKSTLLVVVLPAIALAACGRSNESNVLISPAHPIPGAPTNSSGPPLILPLEVDLEAATLFVRIGFGLDPAKRFSSPDFLTPRLRTIQAQHLIRLVKSYNRFEGERVADVLGRFRGRVSAVEFGRDGSPVLFLELPYFTHQREEVVSAGIGEKISEPDHQALVSEIRQAFVVELNADKFTERGRRIRIWWD